MNLNFNVTGKARGKLANIIAEALGIECTYMKAPTYVYQIGAFTITREGELEFDTAVASQDEIQTAVDAAKAAGFEVAEIDGEPAPETEPQAEDGEDSPETAPENEEGEDDGETAPQAAETANNGEISREGRDGGGEESENCETLTISYPLEGFNLTTLNNLCQMIIAKKPLIQKALGIDSVEIDYDEKEIRFPWFKAGLLTSEEINAYTQFITLLCKTALSKKRVVAKAPESFENPAFSMRTFLINMGMVGQEFALCRKLMIKKLDGNSSWRYSKPENGESKPRKERVEKQVLSVRFTAEMLDKIAELANQSNMTRNALIESVVCEYIQTEFGEQDETALPPCDSNEGKI